MVIVHSKLSVYHRVDLVFVIVTGWWFGTLFFSPAIFTAPRCDVSLPQVSQDGALRVEAAHQSTSTALEATGPDPWELAMGAATVRKFPWKSPHFWMVSTVSNGENDHTHHGDRVMAPNTT